MAAHARLSASHAKVWLNCPGAILLEEQIPDKESAYAAEGTTAHALGEAKILLALKRLTKAKYAKAIKDLEIDGEMEDYAEGYRDYVLERFNAAKATTPDAQLFLEIRLDLTNWVPEGFGTCDCAIVSDGGLEIIDLKYGKGVKVDARDNPQMRLYALGADAIYGMLYDYDTVTMTIYQPRIDNISSETVSVDDLQAWGRISGLQAQAAAQGCEEYHPGNHCDEGFCKARPICRAYAEERQRLATLDFARPAQLSIEEIAEVIEEADRLAKWSAMVKDYALDQAVNCGVHYPGWKVVEGRSNRAYSKPDTEVAALLTEHGCDEEELWIKSLRGITNMETYLGKARFKELLEGGGYVMKPSGKPTLVPFDDKRPELNTAEQAAEDFKDLIA